MRWLVDIGTLLAMPVLGVIAFEVTARARMRDVEEFCAAIAPGHQSESVLEAAAEQELPVFTSATQYLIRTRPVAGITASIAFCDVRFEHGKVTSKTFFMD